MPNLSSQNPQGYPCSGNSSEANFSNEVKLVCTDADRQEMQNFYENIDKCENKLDNPNFIFDKAFDISLIKAWRKALVACNYSLEDVPTLLKDLNSNDEIARKVADAVLIEMGSKAIPALTKASNSGDDNISQLAADVINRIRRAEQVHGVRDWNNAVWKYFSMKRIRLASVQPVKHGVHTWINVVSKYFSSRK